jgi:tripartite ATP-independent transporter DctM subunit
MTWIILLVFALLGAPLFAIIAAGALNGFHQEELESTIVALEFFRLADMSILMAIPLFTFAGYVLSESKAPQRLVDLSEALLGWMPGGLGLVTLLTCAIFTAFTGASGVTIVALGALLYPALKKAGYQENYSLGLVTTSGSLGVLLAPSLPLILYAVVAQQVLIEQSVSVDDLFLAGLLPAALMVVLLGIWSARVPREKQDDKQRPALGASLRAALWELPLPIVVLGGIYGGWLLVSEAAVVTAAWALIVSSLIKREVPLRKLPSVIVESMTLVGAIFVILGVSLASTNFLIDQEVPTQLFEFIQSKVDNRWVFLILLNIFLLILGMLLDIFSALVLIVPILLPVAIQFGIHPVHLGIIFLANMQIGYFTPPVGMNLFISSYRFDKPILNVYRATVPFFFILLLALIIITYWPWLSLAFIDGA